MKLTFDNSIENLKPALKKLLNSLLNEYQYVSVLVQKSMAKIIVPQKAEYLLQTVLLLPEEAV